jgi:hypothetical protein
MRPGKCTPGYPTEEICGNGMDDDFDGMVDEGCDNVCGDGTVCAEGEVCKEEAVCPDCYNVLPVGQMQRHERRLRLGTEPRVQAVHARQRRLLTPRAG